MSIHLIFSNTSERLAAKLAEALRSERNDSGRDPFVPAVVLVPNYNLQKWLQMQIAQLNDLTFNIEFDYLDNGLFKLLKQMDTPSCGDVRLLDRRRLQLMVLSWLRTQDFKQPGFAPFKVYFSKQHSERLKAGWEIGQARKMWQLAEKMAGLIIEYEYHRWPMVRAWQKNQTHTGAEKHNEMAFCQRALYRGLFGEGGLRDRLRAESADWFMTLPQYADYLFKGAVLKPSLKNRGVPWIHIFGHSHLSTFHRDLFLKTGHGNRLNIYQVNACAEFWEDVSTPYEDRQTVRWQKINDIGLLSDESGETLEESELENALLKAWGKPGREALKIYSALEELSAGGAAFHTEWLTGSGQKADPVPGSVLKTVQEQILFRMGGSRRHPQDRTFQVAACPGIFREIETVYNSIVKNMSDDATGQLKLTDIAVLVPNMEAYKPVLTSVFEKGGRVPYNLVDSNASEESVFGQAVLALLALPAGDFTRREVFDLVLNPCFLKGADMERAEAVQWLEWADRLNIYRGFQSSPLPEGQDNDTAPFTWSQGLLRLRFGRIMEETTHENGGSPFSAYKGMVPYADNESQDAGRVGKFSLMMETLFHETSRLGDLSLSCTEWRKKIENIVQLFLGIPDDRPEELSVKKKLLTALKDLDTLDALFSSGGGVLRQLQLPDVVEVIKSCLEDIPSRRGKYLSGGVTVASLQPMRPIPFKIVYIVGLGEGEFPGKTDKSTLDLRKQKGNRKIGDVNRYEADCYLFLETLICVREKLYLSYLAKNLEKDQILHPGSIIKQVVGYLNTHVLLSDFQTMEIPLKGSSAKYLSPQLPFTDLLFNSSTSDRLLSLIDLSKQNRIADDRLKEEVRRTAAGVIPDFSIAEEGAGEMEKTQMVRLGELAMFLKNPAEASIRRHMRLYEEGGRDAALMEDEPFYTVFPRAWRIPVDVLCHAVQARADRESISSYLRDYYEYFQSRSALPSSSFAQVDFDRFCSGIINRFLGDTKENGSINHLLTELRGQSKKMINGIALGENTTEASCEKTYEPVTVRLDPEGAGDLSVQLHGTLPFVWEREGIFTDCLVIINGQVGKEPPWQVLEPFLFYMASAAIGKIVEKCAFTIHIAYQKGIKSYQYQGPSRGTAAAYLQSLSNDFLVTVSPDLLPWDVIIEKKTILESVLTHEEWSPSEKEKYYHDALINAIDVRADAAWMTRRQPELLDLMAVTVPEDAYHKVIRRLTPMFDYKNG